MNKKWIKGGIVVAAGLLLFPFHKIIYLGLVGYIAWITCMDSE